MGGCQIARLGLIEKFGRLPGSFTFVLALAVLALAVLALAVLALAVLALPVLAPLLGSRVPQPVPTAPLPE